MPGNLGLHWFRAPAVLDGRHLSMSSKKKQGVASMVRPQITPPLLPYTIALMEASRLHRPLVGGSVLALLDTLYSRPHCLAARVRELSAGQAQQINHTYDTIDTMVTDFAAGALDRNGGVISTSVSLSPAEHFRFCRAFYRVELFYTLFRSGVFDDDHINRWFLSRHPTWENNMNRWFFSRHPPWENEQLACVYSYLATRLDQDSLAYLCSRPGPFSAAAI